MQDVARNVVSHGTVFGFPGNVILARFEKAPQPLIPFPPVDSLYSPSIPGTLCFATTRRVTSNYLTCHRRSQISLVQPRGHIRDTMHGARQSAIPYGRIYLLLLPPQEY